MSAVRYAEPTELAEATALIADPESGAHLVAGGTALVPLLKLGYVQPALLVGMRRLPGLRGIEVRDGVLVIGSLATHAEVSDSALVRAGWPLLASACAAVGTIRIRNQGTLGGNVVHADPNQDPPPALLVLGASARIAGTGGERVVPLRDLFVDIFETVLEPGEILLELRVPPVPVGCRTAYHKFLPRSQDDYATVSVTGLVHMDGDRRVTDARVGVAGAGTRPILAPAVGAALVGEVPTARGIAAAAAAVDDVIDPISDARGSAAYKRAMARVWVERTLGELCDVAIA